MKRIWSHIHCGSNSESHSNSIPFFPLFDQELSQLRRLATGILFIIALTSVMEPYDQTAILFFSRSPRQEALHKQLAGPHSYQVSKALIRHSLRELRKSKLPICACLGPKQEGDSFGERLANATEAVFAQGYRQLIIVGSDSPGLHAQTILEAQAKLKEKDIVLGPSADGGLYLIGLKRGKYDRNRFIALDWETEKLQASVAEYLHSLHADAHFLSSLMDLDNAKNFADWYPSLFTGRLFRELNDSLLNTYEQEAPYYPFLAYSSNETFGAVQRRGPPNMLHLRA